jgi:L-amino acid N-acyltransferase YncA
MLTVRDAVEADASACALIYRPYVTDTAITFESVPPSPAEMSARIAAATATHAWLVAEVDGKVVGYAYGHPFAARDAYRWSCEVSIYLEMGRRRTGAGRALYEALLARLVERGFRVAVAKMTMPNDASLGLHAAMGFSEVGVHRRIGFKGGAWHDVAVTQVELVTGDEAPSAPL